MLANLARGSDFNTTNIPRIRIDNPYIHPVLPLEKRVNKNAKIEKAPMKSTIWRMSGGREGERQQNELR